jgi:hypothetical protein
VQGKFPKRKNVMSKNIRIFKLDFQLMANSYEDEEISYERNCDPFLWLQQQQQQQQQQRINNY